MATSAAGVLFYAVTGAHLAMVVVGAGVRRRHALPDARRPVPGRDREGIIAAALFWYVTVAVYAVIWYAIYVTK